MTEIVMLFCFLFGWDYGYGSGGAKYIAPRADPGGDLRGNEGHAGWIWDDPKLREKRR